MSKMPKLLKTTRTVYREPGLLRIPGEANPTVPTISIRDFFGRSIPWRYRVTYTEDPCGKYIVLWSWARDEYRLYALSASGILYDRSIPLCWIERSFRGMFRGMRVTRTVEVL